MDTEDLVRGHYSDDDLEAVVIGALRSAGFDVDALRTLHHPWWCLL